jgi:hypothetical protein
MSSSWDINSKKLKSTSNIQIINPKLRKKELPM